MGVFLVIGVLIGIGIGYGVFYFRYEHRQSIDELRGNFTKVQEERDHLRDEVQEYTEQNKILKSKAQMLLDQNEDYAKVVSELSRYYYILRKWNEKLKELGQVLGSYDTDIESKIEKVLAAPHISGEWLNDTAAKRFF